MTRSLSSRDVTTSSVPRPRSVNVLWYPIVWISTFQVTGRCIFMFQHVVNGPFDEPIRRARTSFDVAFRAGLNALGLAMCFVIGVLALVQMRRRTRLVSERLFYLCVVLVAISGLYEFYRPRASIELGLAVECVRAVLAWTATVASIVLIRTRRRWEASLSKGDGR